MLSFTKYCTNKFIIYITFFFIDGQRYEMRNKRDDRSYITICAEKVGKLIGKQGSQIKELQNKTGTKISVSILFIDMILFYTHIFKLIY